MKQKNNNAKIIYQPSKKRKEKPINKSQKSESEMNDDSLDMMEKNDAIKSRLKTSNEEINEEDLKELRTCISNQFKKSNFINFSLIKSRGNVIQLEPNKTDYKPTEITNKESKTQTTTELVPPEISKRNNFLTCHNRSQSCPFIEPLYVIENRETKDSRPEYPGIVFSSVKLDKQRKKISMEYLTKNKNKFNAVNTNLNNEKMTSINHNYSNSLTQSSNTVIVHNLPNDYQNNIITTSNLSNILYHKEEVEDEDEEEEDTKIIEEIDPKSVKESSVIEKKSVIIKEASEKSSKIEKIVKISPHKVNEVQQKFTKNIDKKSLFVIKSKIQQQISQYEFETQKQEHELNTQTFNFRQEIFNKLLNFYLNKKIKSEKECSINSEKLISGVEDKDRKISLKNIQKSLLKK